MKRNLTIAVASIALAVPAIALGQGGAHAVSRDTSSARATRR